MKYQRYHDDKPKKERTLKMGFDKFLKRDAKRIDASLDAVFGERGRDKNNRWWERGL